MTAAHLAVDLVERELDGVAHVVADRTLRAGEGRDKADLDLLRLCPPVRHRAASAAAIAAMPARIRRMLFVPVIR